MAMLNNQRVSIFYGYVKKPYQHLMRKFPKEPLIRWWTLRRFKWGTGWLWVKQRQGDREMSEGFGQLTIQDLQDLQDLQALGKKTIDDAMGNGNFRKNAMWFAIETTRCRTFAWMRMHDKT